MDRRHGASRYASSPVEDIKDGFAGVELYCECHGQKNVVARILFWDAVGQFSVETCVQGSHLKFSRS